MENGEIGQPGLLAVHHVVVEHRPGLEVVTIQHQLTEELLVQGLHLSIKAVHFKIAQ